MVRARSLGVAMMFAFASAAFVIAYGANEPSLYGPNADTAIGRLTDDEQKAVTALLETPFQRQLPDENNAAVVYARLFGMMDADSARLTNDKGEDWRYYSRGDAKNVLQSGIPEPIPPRDPGRLDQREGYDIIYSVAGKDCSFNVDWSNGFETDLSHLAKMRQLARFVAFEAHFDRELNRPDRALDEYRTIFTMSNNVRAEPSLIAYLVGMSIERVGVDGVTAAAGERSSDVPFLVSAADLVKSRPDHRKEVAGVLRSETRLRAYTILRMANDPPNSAEGFAALLKQVSSNADDSDGAADGSARGWLEKTAGLPEGSFNDDTWRTIVRKMVLGYQSETGRLAAALEANPDELLQTAQRFLDENDAQWAKDPQAFFTRQFLPIMTHVIGQVEKLDADNKAAVAEFLEMSSNVIGTKITDAAVPPADAETLPSSESVGESAPEPVPVQTATGKPAAPPAAQAKSIILPFALAAFALVLLAFLILRGTGGRRRT